MTFFTDSPFEKMMIQRPTGGVNLRRPFLFLRLVRPVPIGGKPLVWATVSKICYRSRQNRLDHSNMVQ